jgi:hypothetical protein
MLIIIYFLGETFTEKIKNFQPSESSVEFANTIYVPRTSSARSWLVKIHGKFLITIL